MPCCSNSANDAATVVAEGFAGSETEFAVHMNARARALGAQNSHFVNPHGLDRAGHVSTARDLDDRSSATASAAAVPRDPRDARASRCRSSRAA